MVMTTTLGFVQMYLPLGFYKNFGRDGKPPNFWKNMVIVGTMRFVLLIGYTTVISNFVYCENVLHNNIKSVPH